VKGGKKNFLLDLLFSGVRIPKNHGNKKNERNYENLWSEFFRTGFFLS